MTVDNLDPFHKAIENVFFKINFSSFHSSRHFRRSSFWNAPPDLDLAIFTERRYLLNRDEQTDGSILHESVLKSTIKCKSQEVRNRWGDSNDNGATVILPHGYRGGASGEHPKGSEQSWKVSAAKWPESLFRMKFAFAWISVSSIRLVRKEEV
jgi:hypothetical protein